MLKFLRESRLGATLSGRFVAAAAVLLAALLASVISILSVLDGIDARTAEARRAQADASLARLHASRAAGIETLVGRVKSGEIEAEGPEVEAALIEFIRSSERLAALTSAADAGIGAEQSFSDRVAGLMQLAAASRNNALEGRELAALMLADLTKSVDAAHGALSGAENSEAAPAMLAVSTAATQVKSAVAALIGGYSPRSLEGARASLDQLAEAVESAKPFFKELSREASRTLRYVSRDRDKLHLAVTQIAGSESAFADTSRALRAAVADEVRAANALRLWAEQRLQEATARAEAAQGGLRVTLASLGLGSVALVIVVAMVFQMTSVRPLRQAIAAVAAVAERQPAEAPRARLDEVRQIERVVETLRAQQQAMDAFEARREDEARKAEAERRAAMLHELGSVFGDVVASAAAGDFTVRVDAAFDDPALSQLAARVDELIDTTRRGIDETISVLDRLVEGDVEARSTGVFQGSFARLHEDLDKLGAKLGEIGREIAEAVEAVRDAGREIAGSSRDLTGRSEEQARALARAAEGVHAFSDALEAMVVTAKDADAASNEARTAAERGGEVAGEAIAAMARIEAHAAKIAETTSIIDSIAFQTNLLAVNASIEAARAGVAGKGFAIVAQEVRALASRSAEASGQIGGLVSEASSAIVEGVRLVRSTGETLEDIATSVERASGKMAGLANVSVEQAARIEGVRGDVDDLNQLTRANVEEAERGAQVAELLSRRVEILADLVAFFRRAPDAETRREAA